MKNELPGELVFGKKSVMRFFLREQLEKYPNLEEFIGRLINPELQETCILFSNSPIDDINNILNGFNSAEFGRPGSIADGTVMLKAGDQVFSAISTSNDGYLRNLGLFVTVQDGKLFLQENFVASQKGQPLTVVQAKILKMLGIKVSEFNVRFLSLFDKSRKLTFKNN